MTAPATAGPAATGLRWRDGVLPALVGWVWARLLVTVGYVAARGLYGRCDTPNDELHLGQGLVTWDGTFYDAIATHWYLVDWEGARFFPVYPALARVLAPVLGGRTDLALLLINNVAAFAAALLTWRLVREVIGANHRTAARAAVLVSVFPAAFVLTFAYSEGLAVLAVSATLLALHRRMWLVAGLVALLAAALRPVGGLLLVPIAIELWQARQSPDLPTDTWLVRRRPRAVDWIGGLGGPVLGLVGALLWINAATGDLMLPVRAQQEIRGGFQDPLTRVLEPIGEMLTGNFDDRYNFAFMVLLLALLAVSVRRRQPLSWIAYSSVSLVVVLSAQVTDSIGRYGLALVPLLVALAQWCETRAREVVVALVASTFLIVLSAEAWLGRIVP